MNSIFETRRALVRHGDEAYSSLGERLRAVAKECEKLLSDFPNHLIIRWDITETVLHDEDTEAVPDDYPVLIVEIKLIYKDKLWVMKTCPYGLVIEPASIYLLDQSSKMVELRQMSDIIDLITRTFRR